MEDAANGVENCVSVAFGVRNEKSRLVDMNERQDDTSTTAIAVPLTSRINLRGFNCVETKPSDILKLGYELALARKDDVSDSPGFESCGLIFNK